MATTTVTPTTPPATPPAYTKTVIAPGHKRLGDLLVDVCLITPRDLAQALDDQKTSRMRLGEQLVVNQAITERALADALGAQLDLPVVDFKDTTPTNDILNKLPESVVRSLNALPIQEQNNTLLVAVGDPCQAGLQEKLAGEAGCDVALCVAAPLDLKRAIDACFQSFTQIEQLGQKFLAGEGNEDDKSSPIVQTCDMLLRQAIRDSTSDIHILPSTHHVRIRFRIDGQLHDVVTLPGEMGPALVSRMKVLAGLNIAERRKPLDGQFSTTVDGARIDVRLSTSPTVSGEKAVLRLLATDNRPKQLDALGLDGSMLGSFRDMLSEPFGMILCVGPTGAGKTSTLYATVSELDTPDCNIITIEDPVEYTVDSISQIQINEQAGLTFAGGLRSILRQDPDVILVGEIRDGETARIATQAALTGHMVLSSLHATDAVGAVYRLLDMGVEPFLVGASVLGVSAQRLMRRICYACARPSVINEGEKRIIENHMSVLSHTESENRNFLVGEGCNLCHQTGYQGRIGVFEVLTLTPDMREAITSGKDRGILVKLAYESGMVSLHDQAFALAGAGVTTLTEALKISGETGGM